MPGPGPATEVKRTWSSPVGANSSTRETDLNTNKSKRINVKSLGLSVFPGVRRAGSWWCELLAHGIENQGGFREQGGVETNNQRAVGVCLPGARGQRPRVWRGPSEQLHRLSVKGQVANVTLRALLFSHDSGPTHV